MNELNLQPLTPAAFAPYGEVLDLEAPAARTINGGTSGRADLPAGLDLAREGGRPVLAVFHARAQAARGPWHLLERHRLGSQTFVPLDGTPWVLLVAAAGDTPRPGTLAAFAAGPRQGVTLRAGTWHHPLIALRAGRFLVLERGAAAQDCEVVRLEVRVHGAG
ncbi:ureidoglycolate lyase [Ramlibacter sp. MAHUQ-53]|uniref:ureidoglycolate lyase n=1 Tax=unclassified Ramlibacter TaxID=2617605 RepID=UPI003628FDFF